MRVCNGVGAPISCFAKRPNDPHEHLTLCFGGIIRVRRVVAGYVPPALLTRRGPMTTTSG